MCLLHAVTNFKRCTLSQKVISILRDITQNVAGKRDTTRNISCTVVSRFPLCISCYIAEIIILLQCRKSLKFVG